MVDRRRSPRVERAAAAIRRALALGPLWTEGPGDTIERVNPDALTERILAALIPELWCGPDCHELYEVKR